MKNKIPIIEYLQLGKEQALVTKSAVKRFVIQSFGTMRINPRIRGGRIITEIYSSDLPVDASVLEGGFGDGLVLFHLALKQPKWLLHGYEADQNSVNRSELIRKQKKLSRMRLEKLKLENMSDINQFDLIYSCDVLEHIKDDDAVLECFFKALKQGGFLLLHLPYQYKLSKRIFPWFKSYQTIDHVRSEYLPEEIRQKLVNAGFVVEDLNYGYALLRGELAFELNNFFYSSHTGMVISQLITFIPSLILGYLDIVCPVKSGNSIVVRAKKI